MSETKSKALVCFLKIIAGRLLGFLFFALGSRRAVGTRAWIYFGFHVVSSFGGGLAMLIANPGTLAERDKACPGTPKWDKVILPVYWLLSFFGIYLIAGLGNDSSLRPDTGFWIGVAAYAAAAFLSIAAVAMNKFLESSARIQTDRGQTVVDCDVYRIVRHPIYSSVLLWCVSVSLVFPTLPVRLTGAVIAVLIVARTVLEDAMLRDGLAGYSEYAKKTRWRLIPYIW